MNPNLTNSEQCRGVARDARPSRANPKDGRRQAAPLHGVKSISPPDPFRAIPQVPADVEQRLDSQGSLHLRRPRELRPRHKRIANWLGLDYSHKLTLDENGTRYFALVNGTRTLRAIADAMATATQRDPREMDKGVLLFTKQLMTRHLIELKLPATTHAE